MCVCVFVCIFTSVDHDHGRMSVFFPWLESPPVVSIIELFFIPLIFSSAEFPTSTLLQDEEKRTKCLNPRHGWLVKACFSFCECICAHVWQCMCVCMGVSRTADRFLKETNCSCSEEAYDCVCVCIVYCVWGKEIVCVCVCRISDEALSLSLGHGRFLFFFFSCYRRGKISVRLY